MTLNGFLTIGITFYGYVFPVLWEMANGRLRLDHRRSCHDFVRCVQSVLRTVLLFTRCLWDRSLCYRIWCVSCMAICLGFCAELVTFCLVHCVDALLPKSIWHSKKHDFFAISGGISHIQPNTQAMEFRWAGKHDLFAISVGISHVQLNLKQWNFDGREKATSSQLTVGYLIYNLALSNGIFCESLRYCWVHWFGFAVHYCCGLPNPYGKVRAGYETNSNKHCFRITS